MDGEHAILLIGAIAAGLVSIIGAVFSGLVALKKLPKLEERLYQASRGEKNEPPDES